MSTTLAVDAPRDGGGAVRGRAARMAEHRRDEVRRPHQQRVAAAVPGARHRHAGAWGGGRESEQVLAGEQREVTGEVQHRTRVTGRCSRARGPGPRSRAARRRTRGRRAAPARASARQARTWPAPPVRGATPRAAAHTVVSMSIIMLRRSASESCGMRRCLASDSCFSPIRTWTDIEDMVEASIDPPVPTVGIVGGTGKLGSALAARFARAGVPVVIGSRVRAAGDRYRRRASRRDSRWEAGPSRAPTTRARARSTGPS